MMICAIQTYTFASEDEDTDRILIWLRDDGLYFCFLDRGVESDITIPCPYSVHNSEIGGWIDNVAKSNFVSKGDAEVYFEKEYGYLDVKFSDDGWRALVCNLLRIKDNTDQSCRKSDYTNYDFTLRDDRTHR